MFRYNLVINFKNPANKSDICLRESCLTDSNCLLL